MPSIGILGWNMCQSLHAQYWNIGVEYVTILACPVLEYWGGICVNPWEIAQNIVHNSINFKKILSEKFIFCENQHLKELIKLSKSILFFF